MVANLEVKFFNEGLLFLFLVMVACNNQTQNSQYQTSAEMNKIDTSTAIIHCVYSEDATKNCRCRAQFDLADSLLLTRIKDQFYKSSTGHLYERTVGMKEMNEHLTDYEYFNGCFSQEADPLSFEPPNGRYAKDKMYVYYYRPVSGGMQISTLTKADTKTFKMLTGHYKYAADKNFFYNETQIIEGFIPNKTTLTLDNKENVIEMTCGNKNYKFELVI